MSFVPNSRRRTGVIAAAAFACALAPMPALASHDTMAGDSVLSLPALERTVLERNPSLAAMRAAVAQAEANARRAGSLEDARAVGWVAPRSLGSNTIHPAWGVSIEQPLPVFGRLGWERREARAERDVARQELETTRLDLLRETRRAYYDDYHWWVVHGTTVDVLNLMRGVRRSALARYAAGTAGQQDVLQADVEIAMLEHEAVSAVRNRRVVESRLRALLHLPPSQMLPPATVALPEPDSTGTGRLAVRGGSPWPELAAAEARIESRRAQAELAVRAGRPGTALMAEWDAAMDEPEWRGRLGLVVTLPWNSGRVAAAQVAARAAVERATAERDAARDQLARRLADAVTQYEESLHELEILRNQLVPSTVRAVSAARAGYESGRGDFEALLGAVRDHLRARLDEHRALATANDAAAELERSLGGPAEVSR